MTFLPTGYEVPKSNENGNRYLNKFKEGDTRLRILQSPKVGYEWWLDSNGNYRQKNETLQKGDQPVRVGMKDPIPSGAADSYKHFWAMPVWNYEEKLIQILKITQTSIQGNIENYVADPDWGSPLSYDIVIKRVGKGFNDTEYSVIPKPAKPVSEEIEKAYSELIIDMDAWMRSEDPFLKQDPTHSTDSVADSALDALK